MIDGSPRAVATQPEWLPHSFDADGSRIASLYIPRPEHERLTFLNDQYFQNRYPVAVHNRSAIEAAVTDAPEAPLHFIFHTAFCLSTLLVNAIGQLATVTALKEPGILNDLALRESSSGAPANALQRLATRLLARPFAGDACVVAKASNVANRLIEPLLENRPNSRAILLYSDVENLLLAVAKPSAGRRLWARQLHAALAKWASLDAGLDKVALAQIDDLKLAALGWLIQVHHFSEMLARFGSGRIKLLNSDEIIGDPAAAVTSSTALFGLPVDRHAIDAVVGGPVFRKHSKIIGADYNLAQHRADREAAMDARGEEVTAAASWIRRLAAERTVKLAPGLTV